MATFEPPTYQVRNLPERNDGYSLMRYYSEPFGYSVLIEGGVATPFPGELAPSMDRIAAADAVFMGGHKHTVTAGEQTILETAGYTVTA